MRSDLSPPIELADYEPYPFNLPSLSLTIYLDNSATRVESKIQIERKGSADEPLILDGQGLELIDLKLDGVRLDPGQYVLTKESLTLNETPDRFELEIAVTIDPSANTALSGLYMSGGRFCTQCEAQGFRRITFWPDRPDVLSRYTVKIIADPEQCPILLSNGALTEQSTLNDGRHCASWSDPHPKPSYLFALCAGQYDVHTDTFKTQSGRTAELAIYVDQGEAPRAIWAMECLKNAMRWDETEFGREYDLPVFNIVAVRDFNFGAMENKGLNIFNSAYVLADEAMATDADFEAIESIVAHEYFHNWTGNRITCRDWFQLCLKEGLTVYRDQEFSADMRSRAVQRIKDVVRLRARQFPEDAGPLAHSVRPSTYASIDNLYTATVYEKGAELIRALKRLIGDDAFASGMNLYFDRHDGEAVTIEDFYACFEDVSGQDLSAFRVWYAQAGTPEIEIEEVWDEAAGELTLRLSQSIAPTPGQSDKTSVPIPLVCALLDGKGEHIEAPNWPKGETLLVVDQADMTVKLKCVEKPLLSVNRGFSAPVKINRKLDRKGLISLAQAETDSFNRWDALNAASANLLIEMATLNAAPDTALMDVLEGAAVDAAKADPAYAALLLSLPTVGDLIMKTKPSDPVALNQARDTLQAHLAEQLSDWCQTILAKTEPSPFHPNAEQAGIRALRSVLIDFLSHTEDGDKALKPVFQKARSMTERLSALRALCRHHASAVREEALAVFFEEWKDNPLVLDKWFSVQAASGTVESVQALMAHKAFALTNPNRVRAVAGVFASQSLAAFHHPSGAGHALLADIAKEADRLNPALAARLLTLFDQWKRLEPIAKASAQSTLEALQSETLSQNSSDIVARTLG